MPSKQSNFFLDCSIFTSYTKFLFSIPCIILTIMLLSQVTVVYSFTKVRMETSIYILCGIFLHFLASLSQFMFIRFLVNNRLNSQAALLLHFTTQTQTALSFKQSFLSSPLRFRCLEKKVTFQ